MQLAAIGIENNIIYLINNLDIFSFYTQQYLNNKVY